MLNTSQFLAELKNKVGDFKFRYEKTLFVNNNFTFCLEKELDDIFDHESDLLIFTLALINLPVDLTLICKLLSSSILPKTFTSLK